MNSLTEVTDYLNTLNNFNFDSVEVASEDASFRKYYRVRSSGKNTILMSSPPDKEPIDTFLSVTELLSNAGINVPEIYSCDRKKGILIIEDFGTEHYLDSLNEITADSLYKDAINNIVKMQTEVPCEGLPNYDGKLLEQEIRLFFDWLLDRYLNIDLSSAEQQSMRDIVMYILDEVNKQPKVFVHRDYHSRNLLIQKEDNPGIIDYQDAVYGPHTYDLVSLLKDCYIAWPVENIHAWMKYYYDKAVTNKIMSLSLGEFAESFHIMGVQRHLKASGIFARLLLRDNKTNYIKDIPATLNYIVQVAEQCPKITPLAELIQQRVLPAVLMKLEQ